MLLPPKPSNYSLWRYQPTGLSTLSAIYSITCLHGLDACLALHLIVSSLQQFFFPSCDRGSIVVVLAALPDICHSLVQEWGFFFEFTVFVVSQQIIHGTRISVVGKAVIHFTPRDPGAVRPNRMRHLATFTHPIFYRYHGRPE